MGRTRGVVGVIALVAGLVGPVVATVVAPMTALAAVNWVVTTGADGGAGSMRQAVSLAAPGDVVTFAWGVGPVALTTGPIEISKSLTIRGNGAANTAITRSGLAQSQFSVIVVDAGVTVTIDMVTISGGASDLGAGVHNSGTLNLSRSTVTGNLGLPSEVFTAGVGLYNADGATATVTNSQIDGNTASGVPGVTGGGIANFGALSVANSSVSNNVVSGGTFGAYGGGIYNDSLVPGTITDTIISGNAANSGSTSAFGAGGGVFHQAGGALLTITNSIVRGNGTSGFTIEGQGSDGEGAGLYLDSSANIDRSEISGNTVTGGFEQEGGGVYVISNGVVNTVVTITNSTIANNSARDDGAGVYNGDTGRAITNLISDTVAANTSSGSALLNDFGTLSEKNTIVYNPGAATNCTGTITDNGNNLRFGVLGTCPGTTGDPQLGALADNGGVSQTMALGGASAALNGGANCPAVDQRNYTRTGVCDIGAFDAGGVLPDTTKPVCKMVGIEATNTKKQNVEATDAGRGLQSVTVLQSDNAYVVIPFFLPRTNLTVRMTAVKINQAQISIWRFNSTDAAAPANTLLCT